jgi:hypothetical protein
MKRNIVLGTNNRVIHNPTTSSITMNDGSGQSLSFNVFSQAIKPIINVSERSINRKNRDSGIKLQTKRAPKLPHVPGALGNFPK